MQEAKRLERMREKLALPHLMMQEEWRAPHGWIVLCQALPNGKHNTYPYHFVAFIADDEEYEEGKIQWYSHDRQATAAKQHAVFFVKFCGAQKATP